MNNETAIITLQPYSDPPLLLQSPWTKWTRYFAKFIDAAIALGFATALLALINSMGLKLMVPATSGLFIIYFLTLTIYESISIFKFKTTIGKFLFGISVISNQEKKEISLWHSVKRSVMCSLFGNAFGIPILSFITGVFAYFALNEHPQSLWDIQSETCIVRTDSKLDGVGLFIFFALLFCFVIYR